MSLDLANHLSVGDLDVIGLSIRKWARLALVGNPDRCCWCCASRMRCVFCDEIGATGPQRASFVARLPTDRSWATCYLRAVRRGERLLAEVVAQSGRRRGHRGQSTDFRGTIRFQIRLGLKDPKFLEEGSWNQ
jgi:hypothetical protein